MSHNYSADDILYLILEGGALAKVRVTGCLKLQNETMCPMYLVQSIAHPCHSGAFSYATPENRLAPDEKQAFKMILQGVW